MNRTPGEALRWAQRDQAAPVVTSYDDATGERVELSSVTLGNWVAKTANLLQDEFDIGPGSTVALVLPVHWQTAAALLAVWSCGAAVLETAAEDGDRLSGADVVLVSQDRLSVVEDADDLPELLGLSLHPLGTGMTGYVGEARDFALEVRGQGDVFVPYQPIDPSAPGLRLGTLTLALGDLAGTADDLAARLGIAPGDRIMVHETVAAEAGPVAWLLAPLAVGASLVLCRHPDPAALARRAESERVTATLGFSIEGIRELGRS
jgi:uncharacterized protein (TIGR03089 family)